MVTLTPYAYLYTLVYMRSQLHTEKFKKLNRKPSYRFGLTIAVLLLAFMLTPSLFAADAPSPLFSPNDLSYGEGQVSDQELTRFGMALIEVQEIQIEANEEIFATIEDASIAPERLDEIFVMQQESPEMLAQEATEEEIEEYSAVMSAINTIHLETEQEILSSLEQNSYDLESFNNMAMKIQEDPELLNRLQSMFSAPQSGS